MNSIVGMRWAQAANSHDQRGIAIIEVAITLPFLLVMLLIAGEFTRAFYQYNILTKGVRDAARLIAEDAYDRTGQFELTNEKKAIGKNVVVYGSLDGSGSPLLTGLQASDVTIEQVDLGAAPLIREHIRVTVSYPFRSLSGSQAGKIPGAGFLPGGASTQFTLVASSTMRAL